MSFAPRSIVLASLCLSLFTAPGAQAQPRPPEGPGQVSQTSQASQTQPVFTRARVRSFHEEPDGKAYVRLKLLPRAKLPFTVQTFRVQDRALMTGIAEGAWVRFTATHVAGENTVTAIHVVAECQRFQSCD